MLKEERKKYILELINKNDYMTLNELSEILDVSNMTIRRDVNELFEEKLLLKLYGGVQKIETIDKELSTNEKINVRVEEKKYIGKIMNNLIKDNSTIYIGAGTTLLHAISVLTKKNLFIITNSLIAFNYLIQNTNYRVLLTGGEFYRNTEEFYGRHAERSFEPLNIDIAFAATNGIYEDNITTSNYEEGSIQCVAFTKARMKCIVADSSKFNKADVFTFYNLKDVDYVITDSKLSDQNYEHYQQFTKVIREVE